MGLCFLMDIAVISFRFAGGDCSLIDRQYENCVIGYWLVPPSRWDGLYTLDENAHHEQKTKMVATVQ